MILGTHNSATSGKLVWWQRPFSWFIHLTSRCQDKSIKEQLEDGVRLFNLQVTKYKGEWVFSHGLAIYKEKLNDALSLFEKYATKENPIFFQLYLDDNLFLGQDDEEFCELSEILSLIYHKDYPVKLLYTWIEGSKHYPYNSGISLSCEEHYWTLGWAKTYASSYIDYLPLPLYHAEEYNEIYKEICKAQYLMLDYYDK